MKRLNADTKRFHRLFNAEVRSKKEQYSSRPYTYKKRGRAVSNPKSGQRLEVSK